MNYKDCKIDYIQEMNAFTDCLMTNTLSTGQIALWYALMAINNKCFWKDEFTVAIKSLEALTGLSRGGVYKARNSLKQQGFIDFKDSCGRTASSYRIFYVSNSEHNSRQVVNTTVDNQYTNSEHNSRPLIENTILNYKKDTNVSKKVFIKPSLEEVTVYCKERKNTIDPQGWCDYYESNGWMVGKSHMKDWKASVRSWEKNQYSAQNTSTKSNPALDYPMRGGENDKPFDNKALYSKF